MVKASLDIASEAFLGWDMEAGIIALLRASRCRINGVDGLAGRHK